MAIPIGATPVLTGTEAIKFITMLHKEAQVTVCLTPTPKLRKARALIRQHANQRKK